MPPLLSVELTLAARTSPFTGRRHVHRPRRSHLLRLPQNDSPSVSKFWARMDLGYGRSRLLVSLACGCLLAARRSLTLPLDASLSSNFFPSSPASKVPGAIDVTCSLSPLINISTTSPSTQSPHAEPHASTPLQAAHPAITPDHIRTLPPPTQTINTVAPLIRPHTPTLAPFLGRPLSRDQIRR